MHVLLLVKLIEFAFLDEACVLEKSFCKSVVFSLNALVLFLANSDVQRSWDVGAG
jgi:hypothetical protein